MGCSFKICNNIKGIVIGNTLYVRGKGVIPDVTMLNIDRDSKLIYNKITKIIIEEGITEIGELAFHSFLNLDTVELPPTLYRICRSAFNCCDKLTSIKITSDLYIDAYAIPSLWYKNKPLCEMLLTNNKVHKYAFVDED